MIIRIQTRDDEGRYVDASAGDFAQSALRRILENSADNLIGGDGWEWLSDCLGRFLIQRASECSTNWERADLWYRRYQAIREVK